MSDKEKAAEEHNRFCLNQTIDPTTKRYGVSNYDSFLAGCDYTEKKFRPVKIDPKDESTWPPQNTQILCKIRDQHCWYTDCLDWARKGGEIFLTFYGISHWMPLPEIGE